jgi:hypothetical protein
LIPVTSLLPLLSPLVVSFIGLQPMIFRHPKQHLSQSTVFAMMDGHIVIIVDDGFCPDSTSIACGVEDGTIKVNSVEEVIDVVG